MQTTHEHLQITQQAVIYAVDQQQQVNFQLANRINTSDERAELTQTHTEELYRQIQTLSDSIQYLTGHNAQLIAKVNYLDQRDQETTRYRKEQKEQRHTQE